MVEQGLCSVLVGDREDLLLRVLVYEFRVVIPHMLLRLVDQVVIRLGLDDFATGAMDSLHERLLRVAGSLTAPVPHQLRL